ncbi:hypothetical protein [Flavobacterium akiainvivens]|uniref:hypothetical protein n=1 Tax=Flavobacterium akiainvivens TaxID=1202724 RepID=UPI0006C8B79B|nr:hypothetical protein [Flavobacterium akiainvivens]SFQ71084.1 hypothetical protein SAMN05444144_11677 [Flavobacterium akiainvivens]
MKKTLLLSLLAILLYGFSASAQIKKPETVFKTTNEDAEPEGEKHYFGQFTLSVPLRSNPYRDEYYSYTDDNGNGTMDAGERNYSALDYVWPDGVSAHFGLGVHYHKWIGISANVGIDWLATGKLVSTPVYGALFLSPKIWESTNVYLQAGVGHTFALGRGDLSGTYQKYRVGLDFNSETGFYLEVNRYGFNLYDMNPAGSISIGVSLTDMF